MFHRRVRFLGALLLTGLLLLALAPGLRTDRGTVGSEVHLAASSPKASNDILINITNSGASATGVFEQRVVLDSRGYSDLINSNFTNVRAVYATDTAPVPMWIESNPSNRSAATTLWLRLDSIPPATTVQVALVCDPMGSFDLSESGTTGESPLLSAQYAEFDNGWRVFDLYDNFSGSSLGPLWEVNGAWAVDVHDGAHLDTVPGSGTNITSVASFAYPASVDFYGDIFQNAAASAFMTEGFGVSACTSCQTQQGAGFDTQYAGSGPDSWAANRTTGVDWGGTATVAIPTYGVYTTRIAGPTSAAWEFNYSVAPPPAQLYLPPSPEPVGLALGAGPAGSLTNNQTTIWIREHPFVADVSYEVLTAPSTPTPKLTANLVAIPSTVQAGQTVGLFVAVSGGAAPYSYSYAALPPGCASADVPLIACRNVTVGNYSVTVTVSDALDAVVRSSANFSVAATMTTAPTASSGGGSATPAWVLEALGAGVGAALALAAVGLVVAARRRGPPGADLPAPRT